MTVCGCRSDTTARRTTRVARPPAGTTARRVRDETLPAAATPARGGSRSVDPAHPVDRYFFHQGLGDELGVGVGLLVRLHDVAFRYWGLDKSGRSGENLRQDMASSARMEGRVTCGRRRGAAGAVPRPRSTSPMSPCDCSPTAALPR